MNEPLTLEMIEQCLNEDIPNIDCPSDVEVDDNDENEEELRPKSPLSTFDCIFNCMMKQQDDLNQQQEPELEDSDKADDNDNNSDLIQPSTSKATVETQKNKKGKKVEPNRKWKKRESVSSIPDIPQHEDRLFTHFNDCKTATDIFLKIIQCILGTIIFQTNLYATQNGKTLRLQENEFLAFIGMNFVMGYHKVPSKHHYWSQSQDMRVPVIADTMPRDRFDEILACLHVNDNQLLSANCTDKLYKLRPMIDALNDSFMSSYDGTREVSVDESIVLFKGRNSMKQYNPMKPIKRGYKLWCIADLKGYIFNFDIYQGKNEKMKQEFSDFGLGERVVLNLTKKFWGSKRVVCFDNYFSTVSLMEKLKAENILACGTIRQNRKGLPDNMVADKNLKRGEYDFRVSDMGISFFKWHDNKAINFISNYHGTEETHVRRTQKDGSKQNVPCPTVVADYNKFMGGVDQADRYRVLYGVDRKSKKWWHRIFFALLDIAFVNAYVIQCELFEKKSLLDVRRQIAMGLIAAKDAKMCKPNKRPSTDQSGPSNKRRKSGYSVLKDVRLGNLGAHWPSFTSKRGRCEMCSMNKVESKPTSICSLCKVHLCCNDKKNCFAQYHEIT